MADREASAHKRPLEMGQKVRAQALEWWGTDTSLWASEAAVLDLELRPTDKELSGSLASAGSSSRVHSHLCKEHSFRVINYPH